LCGQLPVAVPSASSYSVWRMLVFRIYFSSHRTSSCRLRSRSFRGVCRRKQSTTTNCRNCLDRTWHRCCRSSRKYSSVSLSRPVCADSLQLVSQFTSAYCHRNRPSFRFFLYFCGFYSLFYVVVVGCRGEGRFVDLHELRPSVGPLFSP